MNLKNYKKTGFYVYSYKQAKENLKYSQKNNFKPYIYFKYYLISKFGIGWIKEILKLLYNDFNKNKFEFVLDCKKNPALAIICISNGFLNLKFDGNKSLMRKIKQIKDKKIIINPKIEIIDLKKTKNCNKYIKRIT